MKISAPQLMEIFGQSPVTLPGCSVVVGGLAPGATRLDTVTVNGVSPGDRVSIDLPASQGTNSLVLVGAEPIGQNLLQVRSANYSATTQFYGTRHFFTTILDSAHLRQTFAISDYMDDDCFLAAVDSETSKGKIYKTTNVFGSSHPVYTLPGKALRQFLSLNVSKQAQLGVCSDPGVVIKTIDGGREWDNIGRLGDEDVLFCAEQEGGPASGTGRILIGTGSGKIWYSGDNGNEFDDKGRIHPHYDQVWGLVYLSGTGANAEYLGLLNDDTGVHPPAIVKLSNYGETAVLLCTLGPPGNDHQGFILLASGALLCGLTDGIIYRLEAPYTSVCSEFDIAALAPAETKARAFVQWADGTIFMGGQNSGYLWISEDDGGEFCRLHRIGHTDSVISMKAVGDMVVMGCGQGLLTGKPYKASVYRAFRCDYGEAPSE